MTTRPISQPTARTFSVDDLVKHVKDGRVRIPQFQRPLRWQWEDVRRLFDSIVKGYPIGSLLLWQHDAPESRVRLGALVIDAPATTDGWWVVDGQQRLTSLANALSDEGISDDRFALAYELRTKQFVRLPANDDAHVIPLHVLFDLKKLLRWFAKYDELSDLLDDASMITKAIREFSIPAYVVEQEDEATLRDIFDRMNNYGRRLSRAEVFSALHPGSRENLEPRSRFADIVDAVDNELRFGRLDDDTVLRAVLARRGGDVTREIRDEFTENLRRARDFDQESQEDAYREGELAIRRAVQFLQRDVGVPHFAFLPYRYLLVVLTRFFAHFPEPEARNSELLRRWFWRAAMIGPGVFSGSWTNAMRVLSSRITSGDEAGSVQRLLEEPIKSRIPRPDLKRFRTNRADTRVALCAMWSLQPRSPRTGEPYTTEELIEGMPSGETLTSIVDRIVRREPADHKNWAANRMFHIEDETSDVTMEFLQTRPLGVDVDTFRAILASHACNEELLGYLSRGETVIFLEERQKLLEQIIDAFLTRVAAPEFEDTPPLDTLDLDDEDGGGDEETE